MKKFLTALAVSLIILGFSTAHIFAKEVSSYELFWPITAGKVMGDSFYSVKTLRENIRGLLIIGTPKKAEYAVLLSTKRLVEAEKLINLGKTDLAEKTIKIEERFLDKALTWVDQANSVRTSYPDQKAEIVNRLDNMKIFLPWLIDKADKNKDSLTAVLQKVTLLSGRL